MSKTVTNSVNPSEIKSPLIAVNFSASNVINIRHWNIEDKSITTTLYGS